MPSLDELAFEAEQDIGKTKIFFPILPALGNQWAVSRPFQGHTIALHLHLTTLTAALLQELVLGGATVIASAANPGTTDPGTVQLLRNRGVEVWTGGERKDRFEQVLAHEPSILVDAGAELVAHAIERGATAHVKAAVVTSRSGVDRLRERGTPPFPVVNVIDGRLHDAVENRHGIGEAVWQAVAELTGMHLAGRRATVVGYGPVGRGLGLWARHAGMTVDVVEQDPVRRLFAHYDGFTTPELPEALGRAHVLVTATGRPHAVTVDALGAAREGLVLVNAGTGGDEVDVAGLRGEADLVDHVDQDVVRYTLPSGTSVVVLGDGHPLNIVLNSGSPEPVLLQYAVVGLALAWALQADLAPGEVVVPHDLEAAAAALALDALEGRTS